MNDPSFNDKLWEFLLSGGVFMAFIALCSLVAMAVSIHRMLTLRWGAVLPDWLEDELAHCERTFAQGRTAQLLLRIRQSDSPAARIARVALSDGFSDRAEASEGVEARAKEEMVKLQNGMGVLEVVITIAPLLGLLGTVSGLVSVFATLGGGGAVSDPSQIAAGIAKALNTTIAGLVVAVITVIFHSFFSRRLESVAARLEVVMGQLLHSFYKQGGPELLESTGTDSPEEEEEPPLLRAASSAG